MKEISSWGWPFKSVRASTICWRNSATSRGARLHSCPYFVQDQTSSSGFVFGAYGGKSSTTTLGCLASHALTTFALLWILLRSQTIVHGPPTSPLSCCKNSTTSSP